MNKLNNQIDENEFYQIVDEMFYCCDESQFKHYCKKHTEFMGCYFCQFDYTQECECEN
jgi:hypothetical protein